MLRDFVNSLEEGKQKDRGYHPNALEQVSDWHICTIVQQCLDPSFILSLGKMSPQSRGHVYNSVSRAMSHEKYLLLQLQQYSNLLLGEMQDWATTCEGTCRELINPDGWLEPVLQVGLKDQSELVPNTDYHDCGELRKTRQTFWYCDEEPRMVQEANINVTTGKYGLVSTCLRRIFDLVDIG
jgi:hypothetical protein